MQSNINKLVSLAGNNNRYQYFVAIMCFFYWFNFELLGFSLAFLENPPMVSYFDAEKNETTVESLDYDICDWEDNTYTIVETYKYSWVIDLGIECEKLKVSLIGTFVSLGMLLGAVLYSYVIKFVGQKKALLGANVIYLLFFILCLFIKNYVFYCIVCIVANIMCNIMAYSVMVLFTEIIDKKRKSVFSACINSGLGIGGLFYVLMFYAIRKWKYVFLISIVIGVVIFILTVFFIFNSLKELVEDKKYDEFMNVLRFIAKFNGRLELFEKEIEKSEYQIVINRIRGGEMPLPINTPRSDMIKSPVQKQIEMEQKTEEDKKDNKILMLNTNTLNENNNEDNSHKNVTSQENIIEKKVQEEYKENNNNNEDNHKVIKTLSPLCLLKYSSIRYTFLLFCILWFFSSALYSGLTIGVKNLPGSIYLNSLLLFIAETPGYFISGIAMNNKVLGRKYSLILFTSCFTLGNLLLYILYDHETPSIVVYLLTRFFVVSAFVIYYTYSLESYPLTIAPIAYGINGSCNSLGGIVVPFVVEYVDHKTLYLAYFIFGVVCVLLMFLLKETNGKVIPEQIKEIEEEEKRKERENNGMSVVVV